MSKIVEIEYTNWCGETRTRRILPHPETLRFGTNEWHKDPQWLFKATCLESQTVKEFAMVGIYDWTEADDQTLPWRGGATLTYTPPPLEKQFGPASVPAVPVPVEPEPLDFPKFPKGADEMNITLVPGATYRVNAEQARKYGKTFERLKIKTKIMGENE